MNEPPPLRPAPRRCPLLFLIALMAAPMLVANGCRRPGHGELSNPRSSRKIAPRGPSVPAPEPLANADVAISSLIDARPTRLAAEGANYTSLQQILEFVPYAQPLRAVHRVADPLLARARRVIVFQEVNVRGGSSDWDQAPEPPEDAAGERSRDQRLRETADEWIRPTTLILYEDAEGIGYITDLPRPLTAAEVVDHTGVYLSGSVTAVHWAFEPSAGQPAAPGRSGQSDRAMEAFRQLVASVGRTELLHGSESLDGCDAQLLVVYEQGAPGPRTVGGVNVHASQTMARHTQAAFEVYRLIDQGVRRPQDERAR